uniref:Formate dehydrogenase n=1 Tax=Solanum tuberosum TaxID=4113 RepID=M1CJN3_SOLTU
MNYHFLGCAENALGIREWLDSKGHQYIVTPEKEGPDCGTFILDLHVLISTLFHPAYVTTERIKKAKNLQLLLTGGIGSDHVDLKAAAATGLTVAEDTVEMFGTHNQLPRTIYGATCQPSYDASHSGTTIDAQDFGTPTSPADEIENRLLLA